MKFAQMKITADAADTDVFGNVAVDVFKCAVCKIRPDRFFVVCVFVDINEQIHIIAYEFGLEILFFTFIIVYLADEIFDFGLDFFGDLRINSPVFCKQTVKTVFVGKDRKQI